MKMNSHFYCIFYDQIVKMASKGNHMLHFFFLKHFVCSIQLAYFERCLELLCIKPLENFNSP